jgi:hypothetical protein
MACKLALLLSSGKEAPNLVDTLHQAVFSDWASPFFGLFPLSNYFLKKHILETGSAFVFRQRKI